MTTLQRRSVHMIIKSKEKLLLINMTALTSPLQMIKKKATVFSSINVLPGANFVGTNSGGMKGACMDVGDIMIGPGKAGGLLMGAACSIGGTWKTRKHNGILVKIKEKRAAN